jgi:uncharacterized protein with von Willebrand factor type A (vWA) domain
MTKIIMAAVMGLAVVSANSASAQSQEQCEQVRGAVAQYGYKAAKAYAQANMSPEAVRAAERCIRGYSVARLHRVAARRHHRRHRVTN